MGDKINFGMRNMEIKKSKPMQIWSINYTTYMIIQIVKRQ
jgi:hypothetical protein